MGDAGWEICKAALVFNEPGDVFAAAVLALEGEDGQRVDDVVKVAVEDVENWSGLVSAIGCLSDEHYQRWVPAMLSLIQRFIVVWRLLEALFDGRIPQLFMPPCLLRLMILSLVFRQELCVQWVS